LIISFGDNLSLAQIECVASQECARMMQTKVTTVIVNATKQGLTMKVGNRNCYARLTSVKVGGEYRMQVDVNWTYQEFVLQDKRDAENQVLINSDDCCDYERITVKEINGKFDVQRDLRKQFRTPMPSQRVALPAAGRCGSANSCRSLADMRFLRLQKDVNSSLRHCRQIRVLERTPNFEVTAQLCIDCNHCSISRFHLK
jgi:hypothetical protein